MKIVFSGIHPTGAFHRGDPLGAVRSHVVVQDQYRRVGAVVDFHALHRDAVEMAERVSEMVIDLISTGCDREGPGRWHSR